MSKTGAKFSEVKELLIKDDEFKEEYEKLKLREELLAVEEDRLAGRMGCTPEELEYAPFTSHIQLNTNN